MNASDLSFFTVGQEQEIFSFSKQQHNAKAVKGTHSTKQSYAKSCAICQWSEREVQLPCLPLSCCWGWQETLSLQSVQSTSFPGCLVSLSPGQKEDNNNQKCFNLPSSPTSVSKIFELTCPNIVTENADLNNEVWNFKKGLMEHVLIKNTGRKHIGLLRYNWGRYRCIYAYIYTCICIYACMPLNHHMHRSDM